MNDFELFRNRSNSKKEFEFLLNVQSNLLQDLTSRLVIPVIKKNLLNSSVKILNPEITIEDTQYILLTQQMAAVPKEILGESIKSVSINRTEILSAIDFLITGF